MHIFGILAFLVIVAVAAAANWDAITSFFRALAWLLAGGAAIALAVSAVFLGRRAFAWLKTRKQEGEIENALETLEASLVLTPPYPTKEDFEQELSAAYQGTLRDPFRANLIHACGMVYAIFFKRPDRLPKDHDPLGPYKLYRDACLNAITGYSALLPSAANGLPAREDELQENALIVPPADAVREFTRAFHEKPLDYYLSGHADPTTALGLKPTPPYAPTPQEEREYKRLLRQYEKETERAWERASELDTALSNTPFFRFQSFFQPAMVSAPVELPSKERFEGAWMVAPSGSGKTNALLHLIQEDLNAVAAGRASVIVIDSSGSAPGRLLHYLSRFEPFKDRLKGRLVVLEPSFDHPLALNLFDVEMERIQNLSGDERAMALSSARSMIEYVLGGLLGAETTKKQGAALGYLIEALMRIPGATIFTLAELLTDEGYDKHREHILKLDPYAVDFFENRFRQKHQRRGSQTHALKNNFAATKQEIFWRIDAMVQRPEFRRMFSHPKNKVDMFDLMQSGKLILINTNKPLLQETGAEVFGRFMIAKIYQAAERRLTIAEKDNLPVYVYIDECHDYIKDEPRIVKLLDQLARKNRIAFTFAHQRPSNLSPEVLDAVSTTAIRFASRAEQDLTFIAQRLRVDDPATISNLDQGEFAYLFREHKGMRSGIAKFPLVDLPLMTEEEYAPIRDDMRRRFSAPPDEMMMPTDAPPHVDEEIDDEESTKGDPDFQ